MNEMRDYAPEDPYSGKWLDKQRDVSDQACGISEHDIVGVTKEV